MAQFSLEINDEMVSTVFDAFAEEFRYTTEKLENETKQEFTRRQVIEWIKGITVRQSGRIVAEEARKAAEQQASDNLAIV